MHTMLRGAVVVLALSGCRFEAPVYIDGDDGVSGGRDDDATGGGDDTDGTSDSDTDHTRDTDAVFNGAPDLFDARIGLDEDTSVDVVVDGDDPDGDALTWAIVTPPANGTLTGSPPAMVYTPDPDFHGRDTVVVSATDGIETSEATVTLTVRPVDDPPRAQGAAVSLPEDTPASVVLSLSEPDGDAITWTVGEPAHGTLSGSPPDLVYTPEADFTGDDAFRWSADDGATTSATVTVALTVTPVNDAPVVSGGTVSTLEDQGVSWQVGAVDVEGDPLVCEVLSAPRFGALTGVLPDADYQPDPDAHGTDEVVLRAFDGTDWSAPATWTISVDAVNDPPVADDGTVQTDEDLPVDLVLVGRDVEGDALTWSVDDPARGTVAQVGSTWRYTPAPDDHGDEALSVRAFDGQAWSAPATVTVQIAPVNDPPTLVGVARTTAEERPVDLLPVGADVDGDGLTYELVRPPSHGAVDPIFGGWTYTPDPDFVGMDALSVRAFDGQAWSAPAEFPIEVLAVDDRPLALPGAHTGDEDAPFALRLEGLDPDGDALTYEIVSPPAHGVLSGTAPDLTFAPDPDFHGADAFVFRVADAAQPSEPATVTLTVRPVNDAPVPVAGDVQTDEDVPVGLALVADDVDGDTLTYEVVQPPANGALQGTPPQLTYVPDSDFHGSDSLVWRVDDGTTSVVATTAIGVRPANDAPMAADLEVRTDEDTATIVLLEASDPEGDALDWEVVAPPTHGTLTGTPPALLYTPDADYHGDDTLTVRASDGAAWSNTARVAIAVDAVNDPPVPAAVAVAVPEDGVADVVLTGTDVDGDSLVFVVAANPDHGTLGGVPPALTYTPDPDYTGPDTITWAVTDGTVWVRDQVVAITVVPDNDRPTALADVATTDEDTALELLLAGTDVEGAALTYEVVDGPAHGTLTGTPPTVTYMPDADWNGTDQLAFRVSDGLQWSDAAAVVLTVRPVNDPPVVADLSLTTDEDVDVAVLLSAEDVDGDPLTFEVVTPPAAGQVAGAGPDRRYEPDADAHGDDAFTWRVWDGTVWSDVARVDLTVRAVDDPPVAGDLTVVVDEDSSVSFTLPGTDPDGDALTWSVRQGPARGSLLGDAPDLSYVPDVDVVGDDMVVYEVTDGRTVATGTVSLTVVPAPDAPVVSPGSWQTLRDAPVAITVAAADADGDAVQLTVRVPPVHGTLTGALPAVTYTPDPGFVGTDGFEVVGSDGVLVSEPAWQAITVSSTTTPPSASDRSYLVFGGRTHAVDAGDGLLVGASDPDGTTVQAVAGTFTTALGGTVAIAADGSFTYTPAPGVDHLNDTTVFEVEDGDGERGSATLTLEVDRTVWYVDNTHAGDGSEADPFGTLAEAVAAVDEGDAIVVRVGDGTSTGLTGAFALAEDVILCGEAVACRIDDIEVAAEGPAATLLGDGPVVTLSDGAKLRGITVRSTVGDAVDITDAADVVLRDLTIEAAGSGVVGTDADRPRLEDVLLDGPGGHGVALLRPEHAELRDLDVRDAGDDAVFIDNPLREFRLLNSTIAGPAGHGVHLTDEVVGIEVRAYLEDLVVTGAPGVSDDAFHVDFGGFTNARIEVNFRRFNAQGFDGDGVDVTLRDTLGGNHRVDVDVIDCTMQDFGGSVVRFTGRDEVRSNLDVHRCTLHGLSRADRVVELAQYDDADATLDVSNATLTGAPVGVWTRTRDASIAYVRTRNTTIDVTDAAVWAATHDDAVQHQTVRDNTFQGGDAVDLDTTDGTANARIHADIEDNTAEGAYRLAAPDFFSVGFWNLELGLPNPPGVVYDGHDDGILAMRGNTTLGGAPVVQVTGSVSTVDPSAVLEP